MTIIMLLEGCGYKTICYRDMENDATRAIHVCLKQIMWYPCSKLRIYKPYMAILCCFDEGIESDEPSFEAHPIFRQTGPYGFRAYVPLNFLVSNFSIWGGYHKSSLSLSCFHPHRHSRSSSPPDTAAVSCRHGQSFHHFRDYWSQKGNAAGKPNIIGIWDMGYMRLIWQYIGFWRSFMHLCVYVCL